MWLKRLREARDTKRSSPTRPEATVPTEGAPKPPLIDIQELVLGEGPPVPRTKRGQWICVPRVNHEFLQNWARRLG